MHKGMLQKGSNVIFDSSYVFWAIFKVIDMFCTTMSSWTLDLALCEGYFSLMYAFKFIVKRNLVPIYWRCMIRQNLVQSIFS